MTEMIYRISNLSESNTALDYFNGFHDGFIKQLVLASQDKFEARGVHELSGRLDLELTIAHYNYQRDTRPHDQLILAKFFQVKDLAVIFSGRPEEWPIITFAMHEAARLNAMNQQIKCLKAVLSTSHFQDNQRSVLKEVLVFTFLHAEFTEQ
jgi:hypothetical protein